MPHETRAQMNVIVVHETLLYVKDTMAMCSWTLGTIEQRCGITI